MPLTFSAGSTTMAGESWSAYPDHSQVVQCLMKHIPGPIVGSYLGVKSSSIFIVPDSSACSSEFKPEIAAILSLIAYREGIRYIPRILVPPACAFVVVVSGCPSTVY
jgi:hypothetical protein